VTLSLPVSELAKPAPGFALFVWMHALRRSRNRNILCAVRTHVDAADTTAYATESAASETSAVEGAASAENARNRLADGVVLETPQTITSCSAAVAESEHASGIGLPVTNSARRVILTTPKKFATISRRVFRIMEVRE